MNRHLSIKATAGVLAAATLATGCSRSGYLAEPTPAFDAVWTVDAIELEGAEIPLDAGLILIDIDTSLASVEAATGCRRLFGSFTLLDDGRAGFTLPGGTKPACDDDEEPWLIELDVAFDAAISQVDSWSWGNDSLVLTGPDAELLLVRAG